MHGFLILGLIGASTAVQLGYNYQQAGQIASVGGNRFVGNEVGGQGIDIRFGGDSPGAANAFGGGLGGFDNSFDTAGLSGNGGKGNNNGFNTASHSGIDNNADNIEFNKEFYTYSAPEEPIEHDNAQQISGTIKKNLRIIFIKAPENQGLTNAALQLAKQATDDRTAIYVLTKQADIGNLANQLQAIKGASAHKPEVHFVKYRTPEEAQHAQQVIQAQYNALGGPSHSSNEGVAPVLNFASPAGVSSSVGAAGSSFSGNGNAGSLTESSNGNGGYLPPAFRRS